MINIDIKKAYDSMHWDFFLFPCFWKRCCVGYIFLMKLYLGSWLVLSQFCTHLALVVAFNHHLNELEELDKEILYPL